VAAASGGGDDDDDADGGPDAPRRREAAEREQWQMHMEEQMQERLRLAKSESEATLAEMADVRRLSARLTAEREMMQVVFAEALASSESDETAGSLSVSRLLEQLCDERDERAHETRVHGAEMLQLHRESSRSRRTSSGLGKARAQRVRVHRGWWLAWRNCCLARELPPFERALAMALAERAVAVKTGSITQHANNIPK
jgi:hypothetical protein